MTLPTQDRASQYARLPEGERIAKWLARAGLCSRREAERWIEAGRIQVNGKILTTPACKVGPDDQILCDGKPVAAAEITRLWLYHKPSGLVTTQYDPQGRPTVFGTLPKSLPRVVSIGRLDLTTEGLLLLTNDGTLARAMELPRNGFIRRYRVRAYGKITQDALDTLKQGVEVEGMAYAPIMAEIERRTGTNFWLLVALKEGKKREVRRVLEHLGLKVSRLIRTDFGPFSLGDLKPGAVKELSGKQLKDLLAEDLPELFPATRSKASPASGHNLKPSLKSNLKPGAKSGSKPKSDPKPKFKTQSDPNTKRRFPKKTHSDNPSHSKGRNRSGHLSPNLRKASSKAQTKATPKV